MASLIEKLMNFYLSFDHKRQSAMRKKNATDLII